MWGQGELGQHPREFTGGGGVAEGGEGEGRRAGDGKLDSHSGQLYLTRKSL